MNTMNRPTNILFDKYDGPLKCFCGLKVNIFNNISGGCLEASCSANTVKFITVNKQPKMVFSGTTCGFSWSKKIK